MNNSRILYLDGLRGILALMVFLHHFLYIFSPTVIFGGEHNELIQNEAWTIGKIVALTPVNIIFNPGTAIVFFFLISGYIQSYPYFQSKEISTLQKSIFKRYFRLAIPTLAVVILIFVFHKTNLFYKEYLPQNTATGNWAQSMLPNRLSFSEVLKFGAFDSFFGNINYYQVLWTMPVELNNSLMILVVLLVTHPISNKKVFFTLWMLILIVFFKNYYGVAFVLGLLIAYLEKNILSFFEKLNHWAVTLLFLLVGVYLASYPNFGYKDVPRLFYAPISFFEQVPVVFAYIIGNVLIFLAILQSQRVQKLLSLKPLLFFGKISFMVYLTHFFLLFSFAPWLYHILQGTNTTLLLTGILTFTLTTAVSFALYKLVDLPTIKLSKAIVSKLFKN